MIRKGIGGRFFEIERCLENARGGAEAPDFQEWPKVSEGHSGSKGATAN
jgi:hypothetical protein